MTTNTLERNKAISFSKELRRLMEQKIAERFNSVSQEHCTNIISDKSTKQLVSRYLKASIQAAELEAQVSRIAKKNRVEFSNYNLKRGENPFKPYHWHSGNTTVEMECNRLIVEFQYNKGSLEDLWKAINSMKIPTSD